MRGLWEYVQQMQDNLYSAQSQQNAIITTTTTTGLGAINILLPPAITGVYTSPPHDIHTILGWLSNKERDQLSPGAYLALASGSTSEEYLNELRLLLGRRFI